MRIALVVPGGVDRSGELRVIPALLALIERLARCHDVHVFALNQEQHPAEWPLAGARIHNLGMHRTRLRALRDIARLHRESPFSLVHAIWSGTCGLIAVTAARWLGIPSLIHIAGGELVSLPDIAFGGRQTWSARLRESWVLGRATCITAASAPIIRLLSELGLSGRRIALGVDLRHWPPRDPVARIPGRPARLIHVASLNRVKDQTTLLQALAALVDAGIDFTMDIVGEDTLNGEIQALAATLGLTARVRFHGFLTQREVRPLVESADLLVMSSRHEAGPIVMLEAAVAGIPTVGTAVGHIAEWAPDGSLAVPVGDWAGLARGIRRLLDDEGLRLRTAREAQQRAVRDDADHCAHAFDALYHTLIGEHPGSSPGYQGRQLIPPL